MSNSKMNTAPKPFKAKQSIHKKTTEDIHTSMSKHRNRSAEPELKKSSKGINEKRNIKLDTEQINRGQMINSSTKPKQSQGTGKSGKGKAKRRKAPKQTFFSILFKTLLLSATMLFCWITYCYIVLLLNPYDEKPQKADAAIVLGAALWNNTPSPALKERLNHTVSLYEEGLVDYVIASGGIGNVSQHISEAEGMKQYLVANGIPEERILLEQHATDTYENLLFSKAIIEKENLSSAIIVSHEYHAYRANSIAKFLNYENYQVSGVESLVLNQAYHYTREVLAYTKWCINRLLIPFGGFI